MELNQRGAIKSSLNRLYKTYEAAGGTKFKQEEEVQMIYNETGFEANKLIFAKKLDLVREKINQRDEAVKSSKGNSTRLAKLNQEVRVMIRVVAKDLDEMKTRIMKGRQTRFFKKALDPEVIIQQDKDIAIMDAHLREVEKLNKRKSDNPTALESLLGSDTKKENKSPLLDHLIMESELQQDPRDSQLPRIDISKSLAMVEENKKKMDKGLDIFEKKLDQLKQMASDIGTELDESNAMLDTIDNKVGEQQEKIQLLNDRTEKAINQVNNTTRLAIVLCLVCILMVMVVVAAIYSGLLIKPI
ncbi:SYP71 [Acrasis kona]|uniref:SYP71 n=1 Tax=Acrasis kona TaxID=1008807 RepID=A0AAW2YS42_9EUKA